MEDDSKRTLLLSFSGLGIGFLYFLILFYLVDYITVDVIKMVVDILQWSIGLPDMLAIGVFKLLGITNDAYILYSMILALVFYTLIGFLVGKYWPLLRRKKE